MFENVFRFIAISCAALALFGAPLLAHADDVGQAEAAKSVARGKVLFLQCRSCHEVKAGQPHQVGPNLHGIMNRKAGAAAGYTYSQELVASGLIWDKATLGRWLEHPGGVVPGNKMAFAGIASAADRSALIAYLAEVTR